MKLLFWGLVAVAFCYLAYSGMIAAWSWIAVNNAVDEIVSKEGVESTPPRELRDKVMSSANEAGVPLTDRDVLVTIGDDRRVRVQVIWTVPIVVVNGDAVVALPLTVRRTSAAKPR